MKVIVNRGPFLQALSTVAQCVQKGAIQTALSGVLLEAEGSTLYLYAGNGAQWATFAFSQVQLEAEGKALVSAPELMQICSLEDAETLTVEEVGGKLRIRSETARYELPLTNPKDFPKIGEALGEVVTAKLSASALADYLKSAMTTAEPAASATEWQKVVHLRLEKGGSRILATDSRRLYDAKLSLESPGKAAVSLPISAVQLLIRILSASDEIAEVSLGGSIASVAVGGFTFRTSVIEGAGGFDQIDNFIPTSFGHRVTADRAGLARAIKRASIAAETRSDKGEVTRRMRLKVHSEGVEISSTGDVGNAVIGFPCKTETGAEGLEIGFNPAFLVKALQASASDEVTVGFTDARRPALVDPGKSVQVLLMPVSLN